MRLLKPSFSSTNLTKTMIPNAPAIDDDFEVALADSDYMKNDPVTEAPESENKRSELKQLLAEFRYG